MPATVFGPRMREFAIEYLLLVGREGSANFLQRLPEQLMTAMAEFLLRLDHFEPRVAQDIADSIALRGSQLQIAIHALDDRSARHAQNSVTVRQRADGEADQQTRNGDQDA